MSDEDLDRLREALTAGGLAIVPTDTVYGLVAGLDVPSGVDALYRAKGRPRDTPCQVMLLGASARDAALSLLDPALAEAVGELVPGSVTCIVPDEEGRYAAAAGAEPGSVGLRAPRAPGVLSSLDMPLIATSANEPGGADPALVEEVPLRLRDEVDVVWDAGRLGGTASAVVDMRPVVSGDPAVLLRPGVDPDALREALTRVGVGLV